mmetsp:Transcript_43979/g.79054  ORF Transcript_43979/g.79054 Transcript_43979/m.79054 type:complete len:269 (+) Transcript_43979:63-869(+)
MSSCGDFFNVTVNAMSGDTLLDVELAPTAFVSDILERLCQAGHYKVCMLLLDACQLEPVACLENCNFSRWGANNLTAVFRTAEGLIADGYCAKDLIKRADISSRLKKRREGDRLKVEGYSALELKATGFSMNDLKLCSPLKDLLELGYTIKEARDARYNVRQLHDAGVTLAELSEAGFTLKEFERGGFTLCELRKVYGTLDLDELKRAGYRVSQVKEFFAFNAMIKAGYSLQEMRQAGYTALTLKLLGGYNVEELSAAGFARQELLHC